MIHQIKSTDKDLFPTIYSAVEDQGPNSIMFGPKSLENHTKIMLLTRDAGDALSLFMCLQRFCRESHVYTNFSMLSESLVN